MVVGQQSVRRDQPERTRRQVDTHTLAPCAFGFNTVVRNTAKQFARHAEFAKCTKYRELREYP